MSKRTRNSKKSSTSPKKKQPKKLLSRLLGFAAVLCFWSIIILIMILAYYAKNLPDISEMAAKDIKPQITIRGTDNIVLAKYGDLHGKSLTYSQLPLNLIHAVIAVEDRRFFEHSGIDILGILRANIINILSGKVVQGGSTITQQLAKIIYLSPERTMKRKIQEAIIALQLERRFSKEQIFAMYLSRVYLGRGNYGIDAAARYYFGKYAQELDLYESAILAAMLKAPSKYSPANNQKLAIQRARHVLKRMVEEGYISESDAKKATPPHIVERGHARGALSNPYFTDYILSLTANIFENNNQNLNIYTTLDLNLQNKLEGAIYNVLKEKGQSHNIHQAAAIAMEPNGAIKAMVGGVNYQQSQFNRAVFAKRQPGSTFKIYIYAAAMEEGYDPSDMFEDKPIVLEQGKGLPLWSPKNFVDRYSGKMTLNEAFANSVNTIAVQLSEKIGRQKVIEIAKKMGITSKLPDLPSIALGAADVSLLELTQSFAGIINNGVKTKGFGILQIKNANNEAIYELPRLSSEIILSADTVEKMKTMLNNAVKYGTGKNANLFLKTVYGKTGTSQDHKDAWFIGAVDDLVVGVWVGNDNGSLMKHVSGGNIPALIWKEFMEQVSDFTPTVLPEGSKPGTTSIFDIIFSSQNHSEEDSDSDDNKND